MPLEKEMPIFLTTGFPPFVASIGCILFLYERDHIRIGLQSPNGFRREFITNRYCKWILDFKYALSICCNL